MKAAVLTEINKPLEILDIELDPPKAGEARVKMKASGVCMSDWHMMNGDWPAKLPLVPGHEAAGVVTEVGPGPSHVSVGDHVIFSFSSHCGHCRYCNSGKSVLCNGHSAPGFLLPDGSTRMRFKAEPVYQMARIGTFREEVVCSTENLVPIRKDLPWTIAAIIGCSVATGVGAVYRAAKVEAGSSVVVIGCGGVGLNIVQGAKLVGAGKIIAVDLLDNKLDYARQFGATHTINGKTENVVKRVREITGGGADYAFDALGSEATGWSSHRARGASRRRASGRRGRPTGGPTQAIRGATITRHSDRLLGGRSPWRRGADRTARTRWTPPPWRGSRSYWRGDSRR